MEKILNQNNLNRAYKRVKANKEAPCIEGITADEIGAYLWQNQKELKVMEEAALVPNGMPGDVRGRELVTPSYSIL